MIARARARPLCFGQVVECGQGMGFDHVQEFVQIAMLITGAHAVRVYAVNIGGHPGMAPQAGIGAPKLITG